MTSCSLVISLISFSLFLRVALVDEPGESEVGEGLLRKRAIALVPTVSAEQWKEIFMMV